MSGFLSVSSVSTQKAKPRGNEAESLASSCYCADELNRERETFTAVAIENRSSILTAPLPDDQIVDLSHAQAK